MRMITGILAATILLITAWTAAAQAQTPDQIVLTTRYPNRCPGAAFGVFRDRRAQGRT